MGVQPRRIRPRDPLRVENIPDQLVLGSGQQSDLPRPDPEHREPDQVFGFPPVGFSVSSGGTGSRPSAAAASASFIAALIRAISCSSNSTRHDPHWKSVSDSRGAGSPFSAAARARSNHTNACHTSGSSSSRPFDRARRFGRPAFRFNAMPSTAVNESSEKFRYFSSSETMMFTGPHPSSGDLRFLYTSSHVYWATARNGSI